MSDLSQRPREGYTVGRCAPQRAATRFGKLSWAARQLSFRFHLAVAALCAALVVCIAGPGAAHGQELDIAGLRQRLASGVLRWGGDAEGGAPYQLRDPKDPEQIIGFEVELMQAIAGELSSTLGVNVRAEFVQYDWVTLALGLNKGDFDCIASGLEITPDNQRHVLFSRPYYVYAQQLVVRSDERHIASLDDCLDKAVGTLSGSAAEQLLEEAGARQIIAFEGQVEPYLDLANRRLDAVVLDLPIAVYYAGEDPRFKFVGERFGHGNYGIGLRKDDALLAAAIDEALSHLMANGRLRDIYRRWRLWNPDQADLAQSPHRAAELTGLGFDEQGQPLAAAQVDMADVVDTHVAAASAEWKFRQYAPLLLASAGMTVFLTVVSMALAMAIGLLVCVCRLYGPAPVRWGAIGYVEFFRGVPLLLLLFFLYFGMPTLGIRLDAVTTAIIGFGLNYAAYEAEIYRSAILAVPRGQWEAARALGMNDPAAFRRVVFPQAGRTALGPITNDFVALFKDTSLVSVIAVRELTKEYLILARSSMMFIELGVLTALLYLAMSVPLGYLSRRLEERWGAPRH